MKKFVIVMLMLIPMVGFAQTKTWSYYLDGGAGYSTPVELRTLSLSTEGQEFFAKRGLDPDLATAGEAQMSSYFGFGISRYFAGDRFRISLQGSSQYVYQTNFHATNISGDVLFGVDFLKVSNHELFLESGIGVYHLDNDYIYHWDGKTPEGEIIESYEERLGEHTLSSFSVPTRLTYAYNIAGHHWFGVYGQIRTNYAENVFCPSDAYSVGIQYRYILGKSKAKKVSRVVEPYVPKEIIRTVKDTVYVTDTVYVEKLVEKSVNVLKSTYCVLYDVNSTEGNDLDVFDAYLSMLNSANRIEVIGFADRTGNEEYNLELSFKRALGVKKLIEAKGISVPVKISCAGFYDSEGESDMDRRVEVRVY